jgi:uncharacterized protein YbbK (DUF523 family)
MENILVSACLLGEACRWHGKKQSKSSFVKRFVANNPEVNLIPVCPEVLGGLPVPRPPVKRVKGKVYETCSEKENRKSVTGKEVTDCFIKGAEKTLEIAKDNGCAKAIFCSWSPSCGESGIATRLLQKHGIEVVCTF